MIFEKVKSILSEQFEVEEESITMETRLIEDLGADSLDVVDLAEAVEDEFETEIPDSEIENISTVGDIVLYISEATGTSVPPQISNDENDSYI